LNYGYDYVIHMRVSEYRKN